MGSEVVVVGSVNVDLVLEVDRRPDGGETVLATGAQRRPGGKGANQAAAAARAGAGVRLVAAVGDDADAGGQLDALRRDGVDTAHVRRVAGSVTGLALITVTPDGENAIVVVPGANHVLSSEDAVRSLDGLAAGTVVVVQTEVRPQVVDAAAAVVAARRCRLVLSDGPVAPLAPSTLAVADPVVVNRSEARQLAGRDLDGEDLAGAVLAACAARSVVVTLGAEGAVVAVAHGSLAVPGAPVPRVVDTTGAGDVLVGTLAAGLAGGLDLPAATAEAVAAAGRCVGWPGARPEPD